MAVLPFENLSDDKENAFFTDGVQDRDPNDPGQNRRPKVISRTGDAIQSGAPRNLREIGEELGVAHCSKAACSAPATAFE